MSPDIEGVSQEQGENPTQESTPSLPGPSSAPSTPYRARRGRDIPACQVCNSEAKGYFFGAYVCFPCKVWPVFPATQV